MAKTSQIAATKSASSEETDLLGALRKLPVFKGITVEVLTDFLETASDRIVLQGDFIFKQGDPGSTLVIFTKGLAVEFKQSGNIDCLLNYYNEPAVLGEVSFLECCPRTTSLYANDNCWITEIDNSQFQSLVARSSTQADVLFQNLGRELGKKASIISSKLEQASHDSFIRESTLTWYYQ